LSQILIKNDKITKKEWIFGEKMQNNINSYLTKLQAAIDNLNRDEIETFINLLIQKRNENKQIFIMGNGGSATTAGHFFCDYNKGLSYQKDKKFKMICLNDNIATMLAYANDISYEDIFVEQLKNFLNEGDVVIGLSASGNSKNVLKAIEYANNNNAITVGITGYNGGILKQISKYSINANVDNMQISEDIHLIICHLCYSVIEKCD
jgi:D-sedoheptulose 7-phosphate isomerase